MRMNMHSGRGEDSKDIDIILLPLILAGFVGCSISSILCFLTTLAFCSFIGDDFGWLSTLSALSFFSAMMNSKIMKKIEEDVLDYTYE